MNEVFKPGEIKPKASANQFEVPFDSISLPSRGILYKNGTLAGKDSVEVHYLTAKEEDILTSPNLIQSGRMLDILLKSVLKDKTIEPGDFLLGDRNAIIIWLRSTGYGEKYPIRVVCKECGEKYENEFDLNKLEERELTEEPDQDGLFFMTLPSGKEIRFRLATAKDELDIIKKAEELKKKVGSNIDKSNSLTLKTIIMEVDGDGNKTTVSNFVDSMSAKDTKAFKTYMESIEPGILMVQEATCVHCGETNKEVIPIKENFFWPDSRV